MLTMVMVAPGFSSLCYVWLDFCKDATEGDMIMGFTTPTELKYLKTHEWVRMEGEEAVIGITDFAQDSLGDIVYIEMPKVGDTFGAEETFGVIESVKASSDLYAPVGGEVIAVNEALEDDQAPVNKDPYGEGWLIRLKVSGEQGELIDATEYEKVMAEQSH
jgi:glycine cleavage system H protein